MFLHMLYKYKRVIECINIPLYPYLLLEHEDSTPEVSVEQELENEG